jgi:hypothetical protein
MILFARVPIRNRTSPAGRDQFSVEKANSVSHGTPSASAAATIASNEGIDARWPCTRSSPRAPAHRPLPSMMQATCRTVVVEAIYSPAWLRRNRRAAMGRRKRAAGPGRT